MRQIHLLLLIVLLAACAGRNDYFVLRGYVPGALDSTEVELSSEQLSDETLASGYIIGERFELRGKTDFPVMCCLSLNDQQAARRLGKKNAARYVEANFFVENGKLTFQTAHIDSLPRSFEDYDFRQEKNYTVTGSLAQDIYAQYLQACADWEALASERRDAYAESARIEDFRSGKEAQEEVERRTIDFIRNHDHLYVSLFLGQKLLKQPFTYDQAYLTGLQDLFSKYRDTCEVLQDFRASILDAAAFVQGKELHDARLLNPSGDTVALFSLLDNARYTLIDFWASWCGPCRASFPHLRQLYQQYGKKIQFLSVSVDKRNSDWQQAMKEERLPWSQFVTTPEFSKEMKKFYGIHSVPTFLLISPDKKIIFSGYESGELEIKLEEMKMGL